MATPERTQLLTSALRAAASRAAELAGGGAALLFARMPGDPETSAPRLRAAAGFGALEDARGAATELEPAMRECVENGRPSSLPGDGNMGDRASAGVQLIPLEIDGRIHGAMAVGSPKAIDGAVSQAIALQASTAAIHIDHILLSDQVAQLREALGKPDPETEDPDELLKLSETLFAQDIELMRNNEKLGQIEKIKSDFIEKMSRELRTPLNSIIEATIAVLSGENENLSDGAKERLRLALDEGTTFQRTLQNILDLWRIKQGEMAVQIQDLNFAEVVDEAIFSVQDSLRSETVAIRKRMTEPLPKIKTDLAKVNQVLFLLLDNAVKFTLDGDIEITAQVESGMLRCQIEDTGIGVCPDDQQYIFDEFFQVDAHATSEYRGAGLGLSLVRDLLGLLEGSCTIKSEAGHGTIAVFEIPVILS
jgi:signal transduction histidine kinase